MRKGIIGFAVILCFLTAACKKGPSANSGTSQIYKGMVLHSICCLDVIQTLGSDTLGQNTWIDSNAVPVAVYHHVFKVSNPCQFTGGMGDTISFRVIQQQVQNCACCLIAIYTPATSFPVQVVN